MSNEHNNYEGNWFTRGWHVFVGMAWDILGIWEKADSVLNRYKGGKEIKEPTQEPVAPPSGSKRFLHKPKGNDGRACCHFPCTYTKANSSRPWLARDADGDGIIESARAWYFVPQNGRRMLARWRKKAGAYGADTRVCIERTDRNELHVWTVPDFGKRYDGMLKPKVFGKAG